MAVGDIHGQFTKLEQALDAMGFDPARDRLFGVGDLVDRGPESHRVLDWLDKPWFHAVCGNHDFMAWRRALGIPDQDVDHRRHGGEWLDALTPQEQHGVGQRLAALPLVIEVDTPAGPVGIVHADCPYDDWFLFKQAVVAGASASVAHTCLWSIERWQRQYRQRVANVRALVHGHVTTGTPLQLGNCYFIDTGGWDATGHFSFLDLHSLQVARGSGGSFQRWSRRVFR